MQHNHKVTQNDHKETKQPQSQNYDREPEKAAHALWSSPSPWGSSSEEGGVEAFSLPVSRDPLSHNPSMIALLAAVYYIVTVIAIVVVM